MAGWLGYRSYPSLAALVVSDQPLGETFGKMKIFGNGMIPVVGRTLGHGLLSAGGGSIKSCPRQLILVSYCTVLTVTKCRRYLAWWGNSFNRSTSDMKDSQLQTANAR